MSEVGQVGVGRREAIISVIVLLLEMLVRTEFTEQSEENVQGFNDWLAILQLMNRYITHGAYDLRVVGDVHIDFRARERRCLKCLFHFWWPFLH